MDKVKQFIKSQNGSIKSIKIKPIENISSDDEYNVIFSSAFSEDRFPQTLTINNCQISLQYYPYFSSYHSYITNIPYNIRFFYKLKIQYNLPNP